MEKMPKERKAIKAKEHLNMASVVEIRIENCSY